MMEYYDVPERGVPTPKLPNYILVRGDERCYEAFCIQVHGFMAIGYVPQGGVAVRAGSAAGADLIQAMVRR